MDKQKTISILNGPNLNLLGTRETEIYGTQTLGEIEAECKTHSEKLDCKIDFRQSNSEGELVDWIQEAENNISGLIINPAAYTHTSVAILDALKQLSCPIIEVHLSNIFTREPFRHHSFVSPVAKGMICGFGTNSYILALNAIKKLISKEGDF